MTNSHHTKPELVSVPDTLMGLVALPWEAVAWIGSVV